MVMHYHEGEEQSLLQGTHLSLKDKYKDKPNTTERIKLSHALTKKVIGMSELYEIDCSIYQYERKLLIELMPSDIPFCSSAKDSLSGLLTLCDTFRFLPAPADSQSVVTLRIELYYYDWS